MKSSRILELDATRGAAMGAVLVTHSSVFLLDRNAPLVFLLTTLGMVATPTFLLLSGAVCSELSVRPSQTLDQVRWRLIDRGLFLLIVAHLVFGLTHAMWMPASMAFGSFYITDALGVCLIVAAFLTQRVKRTQLLLIGGFLLFASWVLSSMISPHETLPRSVARVLVGTGEWRDDDTGWIVPLVPYLGVFLIGMAIGATYSESRAAGRPARAIAGIGLAVGMTCAALAVALKLGWLVAKPHLAAGGEGQRVLYAMTDPLYKIPPGPAYLLAFAGAGLCMASFIVWLASTELGRKAASAFAVVGRASLFVFLAQYWLMAVPAEVLHAQGGTAFWLVGIVLATGGAWALAALWDAMDGNRILTLGLGRQCSSTLAVFTANETSLTRK